MSFCQPKNTELCLAYMDSKIKITECFLLNLEQYREVSIPGLGTFKLRDLGSVPDWEKMIINPPSVILDFHWDNFEQDRVDVQPWLKEFGERVIVELKESGYSKWEGLGVFYLSTEGLPVFESGSDFYLGQYYDQLSPVSFQWIRSEAVSDITHMHKHTTPVISKRSTSSWRIWAILLLIPLLIGGWIFLKNYVLVREIQIPEDRVNLRPTEAVGENSSSEGNADDSILLYSEVSPSEYQGGTLENPSLEISNTDVSKLSKSDQGEMLQNQVAGVFSKNCKVVVGSFLDTANSQRFAANLVERGYTVITSKFGDFTRVIVTTPCESIESTHRVLQNEISKNAWVIGTY